VVGACIDEVASVSRLTARRMAAGYRFPDSKFRLLPNAVDPPGSVPARPTVGRPPRLLTVARLSLKDRYKGCDRVLHALPRVLAEVPGARYDIVGDGPLRPELEQLAERLGVRRAVRFLGYVDDDQLEAIYRQARLMVMPSTGEGFGIVFLEAWKHGLPVVAGNRDASREVVEDGVTGLCVDPESPEEIGQAVVRLLADPDYAARLGTQGYRTLLERYTHEKFRDNLREILRRPAATGCGAGGASTR
jgi:glycosyltransferase involved in cell wall biosynthesis